MEWAAALALYIVVSLFPLLLAGAAVAAYFVAPSRAALQLSNLLAGFIPPGVVDFEAIVTNAIGSRRQVGLVAILVWLFAGRRILGALVTALDRVSDVDEEDESLQRRAWVEMVLLAGIGALFLAALSARSLFGLLGDALWGPNVADPLAGLGGAIVHAVMLVAAFYVLYTVVPHGTRERRSALVGAGVATALLLAARGGFLATLDRLWASFSLIYGPLAFAALLLLWAWIVGVIVLLGDSLASHIAVMLIDGKSAREAEQRHVARKPQ